MESPTITASRSVLRRGAKRFRGEIWKTGGGVVGEAMKFQGCLNFLFGQNERTAEGKPIPPQLALFALACPLQPPSILEIRTKSCFFKTKHKLDFTPTACDIVLGYTEEELCYRGSGYQFIHAADMLYCAENHIRMMTTDESGLTVFRLLTKQNLWVWVQSIARLVYKNGQPDCIIDFQRVIVTNPVRGLQIVLSLSESSLFKQEPIISSGGDDSCEILNFMGSLGISPEDLKFLQDELLLRIDLDGWNDVAYLTDGIFSYVQHSLRTNTDCTVSGDNVKEKDLTGKPVQTFTPPQQTSAFLLQDSCDSLTLLPEEQQMTFITEHPEPKTQHVTQIQSHIELQAISDLQNNPQGHQHKMSQLYNGTGITQCQLSQITIQKHQVQAMSQQSQCSYLLPLHPLECKTLRNAQVCGNLSEVLASDTQQVPPLFQPEFKQPGCFYLETPPLVLKHLYRNHLSTVSFSCSQQHSPTYITTGDTGMSEFTAQDLKELLNGLDGDVERTKHSGPNRGVGVGLSLDQQDYIGQSCLLNGSLGNPKLLFYGITAEILFWKSFVTRWVLWYFDV
uniref:Aryl hydrocarbon receptor 1a n=1 Tax=Sinocyclocheilus grahami TaxID=75366 RepID=A0A672TEL6_SINGR